MNDAREKDLLKCFVLLVFVSNNLKRLGLQSPVE